MNVSRDRLQELFDQAITLHQRMRGLSRLGGFMVRRATRRILDEALDGLELAVG